MPQCSEDMEKGDFSLPNNTVWTPAGVKVKFGVIAEDMVWLAKRWNLFPQPAKGYICRACKMAVLKYPGK